jgi:two-component system, cell cycle sensor histidine kinase and response regulator CckA
MDLTIPGGMGGKEAIQRLRELDPDVRAVVSSGYSNDPVMSAYRQHGFRAMVEKPYTGEELSAAVRAAIEDGLPTA